MDCPGISRAGEDAVKGVDFANQMALAEPANGRVAAHRADHRGIKGHERDARAHAGRDGSGFNPGMSSAYYDDVELVHEGAV